jgi:hypothetical protein
MKQSKQRKREDGRWRASQARQDRKQSSDCGDLKYENGTTKPGHGSHRSSSSTTSDKSPEMARHTKLSQQSAYVELRVRNPPSGQSTTEVRISSERSPPTSTKSSLTASDQHEPNQHINTSEIPIPRCTGPHEVHALLKAPHRPPINRDSLEELEIGPVQTNITLRVDINFDHELHFQPIRGSKDESRRHDATQYASALENELKILYQHGPMSSCSGCQRFAPDKVQKTFKPRLRTMFEDLKALLVVLIPDRDQYELNRYLDIPFLMQEAQHGMLDIVALASWLDGLLTNHCAPIRDLSAHQMAEQIRLGVEDSDFHKLVAGIEKLFLILESMKLDVANHQIRTFRPLLIEDTVAFQQEFFRPRFKRGSQQSQSCQQWYRDNFDVHQKNCANDSQTPRSMPLAALIHGLLAACRSTVDLKPPQTFNYDYKRLKEVCVDIQDFIHVEIALATFEKLVRCIKSTTSSIIVETKIVELQPVLRNRILDITDGDPEDGRHTWTHYAEAIAVELVRTAHQVHPDAPHNMSGAQIVAVTTSLMSSFEQEHQSQQYRNTIDKFIEISAHFHAKRFQNMTTLQISQEQREWQLARARQAPRRLLPDPEDVSRRLAHIVAVHWRVWAELVYQDEEEDEDGDAHVGNCTDTEVCEGPMVLDLPLDYVRNTRN